MSCLFVANSRKFSFISKSIRSIVVRAVLKDVDEKKKQNYHFFFFHSCIVFRHVYLCCLASLTDVRLFLSFILWKYCVHIYIRLKNAKAFNVSSYTQEAWLKYILKKVTIYIYATALIICEVSWDETKNCTKHRDDISFLLIFLVVFKTRELLFCWTLCAHRQNV